MTEYQSTAINQVRAKDGNVYPKAPAGIACPVGWVLTENGTFIREPKGHAQ